MEYILETHNLGKRYKDFKAVSNLDMHIPKGAIYGLVGKNGAGKTTCIRLICGLQKPTTGTYSIYGVSIIAPILFLTLTIWGLVFEVPYIE